MFNTQISIKPPVKKSVFITCKRTATEDVYNVPGVVLGMDLANKEVPMDVPRSEPLLQLI